MSIQNYMIIDRESGSTSNFVVHEPSKNLIIVRNSWSSGFEELALDGDSVAVFRCKYWNMREVKKIILPQGAIFSLTELYSVMQAHKGRELSGDRVLVDLSKGRSI